jgi:hypothetical protein
LSRKNLPLPLFEKEGMVKTLLISLYERERWRKRGGAL